MSRTNNFDADVEAYARLVGKSLGLTVQRIALDLTTRIMERTPVDTGRARSGWDLEIGEPSTHYPPAGADSYTEQVTDVSGITGKEEVFIVNNLEYIEPLEMGHSAQASAGMLRVSMAEVAAEIELRLEKAGTA